VLKKLVEEIDAAFEAQDSEDQVLSSDWWSTPKLQFLEACIHETLRLNPVVPG
jgi:cytochrome P450